MQKDARNKQTEITEMSIYQARIIPLSSHVMSHMRARQVYLMYLLDFAVCWLVMSAVHAT